MASLIACRIAQLAVVFHVEHSRHAIEPQPGTEQAQAARKIRGADFSFDHRVPGQVFHVEHSHFSRSPVARTFQVAQAETSGGNRSSQTVDASGGTCHSGERSRSEAKRRGIPV